MSLLFNIRPKKSLGQNFLIDANIRQKIVASLKLEPLETLLEIGAGRGELSEIIASKVDSVYAVELDKRLAALLKYKFQEKSNVKIINRDILKLDLNREIPSSVKKIKVFGNIPYYISSPIIERLTCFEDRISAIYLMLQKEFAQRLTAEPGTKEYGSFSCFVQFHFRPEILFYIKKTSFSPQPKVDSAFVRFECLTHKLVAPNDREDFFKVIRSAFGKRRKTLTNSLQGLIPKDALEAYLSKAGLDKKIRPERLGLRDFSGILGIYKKHKKNIDKSQN